MRSFNRHEDSIAYLHVERCIEVKAFLHYGVRHGVALFIELNHSNKLSAHALFRLMLTCISLVQHMGLRVVGTVYERTVYVSLHHTVLYS